MQADTAAPATINPVLSFVRGFEEPIAMDPLGLNRANPLVHLSCRKALAHAFDGERFVDERHQGLVKVANGPFPPGSVGYLEDSGYPSYDRSEVRVSRRGRRGGHLELHRETLEGRVHGVHPSR